MNNSINNINNTGGYALDWDSEITSDGDEYALLDEGDYDFVITAFERSRSSGSGKLPSSPMAIITLRVTDAAGNGTAVKDNIILHSSVEWKLGQFFHSIGMKKQGEKLRPQWDNIIGKKGRCHVYIDTFTGNDGSEKKNNKVQRYLPPDAAQIAAPAPKKFW